MRFLSIYKHVERNPLPSPEEMARMGKEGYLFRSGTRNGLCFQNVSACADLTIAL